MTKKSQILSFANYEMKKFSIIKIFFIFFSVFFLFSSASIYNHTTNDKVSNILYFDSNFVKTAFSNFHAFYILAFVHKLIFIRSKIKFSFISYYCFSFFLKKSVSFFFHNEFFTIISSYLVTVKFLLSNYLRLNQINLHVQNQFQLI